MIFNRAVFRVHKYDRREDEPGAPEHGFAIAGSQVLSDRIHTLMVVLLETL